MVDAIVFDVGGVIIHYDPKKDLADRYPDHADILYDLIFNSAEWDDFDAGILKFQEASDRFLEKGQEAGLIEEVKGVLSRAFTMLSDRPSMRPILEELKARDVPLFYLSNMSVEVKAMMRERDIWQLFNGGIASSDIKILKPHPAIYQALLDRYQLDATRCLYVDDTLINCEAAEQQGFKSIYFTSDDALIDALRSCGIIG